MAEGALEKVMLAFADGDADVLVCTTIIESGLDIPNANTIVIDRADTLGLAQLYQLRGRVGPLSTTARTPTCSTAGASALSDEARKRLQAIFNASELGAGFQIAMRDLEIRGAGNILGGEQSGHIAAVGFDLYSRLLAEAVEAQKASVRAGRRSSRRRRPSSTCRSRRTCPTTYVPDEAQKLELYRRLARATVRGRPRRVPPGGHRPLRPDAGARSPAWSRSPSCGWPPRPPGVASISREEGWLVVRFGAALTRATAMRLLGGRWPARRAPADVTFASNQVRIRLPATCRQGLDADPGRRRAPVTAETPEP